MDGDSSIKGSRTNIVPRTDEAIDFLKKFRADGPWVLTAIKPAGGFTDTRTFYPKDEINLAAWIGKYQGLWNLYFMVNPPKADLSKKAEKSDVAAGEWLYIDVDPRPGEDIELERQRALKVVAAKIEQTPNIVIDSGGGFQFFWLLDEHFELSTPEEIAEYESYNRRLIQLTLADKSCFNVDRIMRLPGTINVPTPVKKKKGRVPVLARLVSMDGHGHDINTFGRADTPKTISGVIPVKTPTKVSVDLDALDIAADVKSIIVRGEDITNSVRWPSRSEALWYVCCSLVRAGVEPDAIYSIITDRDLKISESVLEQHNPDAYAKKQVNDALAKAFSSELLELNEKHFVVGNYGGKCRVIETKLSATFDPPRFEYIPQQKNEFMDRYSNRMVKCGVDPKTNEPKYMPLGKWWWEQPTRRQYEYMEFAPDRDLGSDTFNMWQGWAVKPNDGDPSPWIEFTRDIIAAGDLAVGDYFINWAAQMIQHPGTRGKTAIVLQGAPGTGKTKWGELLGSFFGQHFSHAGSIACLTGTFNAELQDCCLILIDEAFADERTAKAESQKLKHLITTQVLKIEPKGVNRFSAPSYLHVIFTSNELKPLILENDDRRYVVQRVSDAKAKDIEYFGALTDWWEKDGAGAVLNYLRNVDLSDFRPERIPETKAKQAVIVESDPLIAALIHWIEVGQLPQYYDGLPPNAASGGMLAAEAYEKPAKAHETKAGLLLKRLAITSAAINVPTGRLPDGKVVRSNPTFHFLPSPKECAEMLKQYKSDWGTLRGSWASPPKPVQAEVPF